MKTSKHVRQTAFCLKKVLAKNGYCLFNMTMNLDIVNLNLVRTELANSELQTKALRQLVQQLEACQQRFNSIIEGIPVPPFKSGLTKAVKAVIDSAPSETFTTTRIRLILKDQGVNTKPRNFNSSLSTTLTRLGRAGFVEITTDADGTRIFKKKGQLEKSI